MVDKRLLLGSWGAACLWKLASFLLFVGVARSAIADDSERLKAVISVSSQLHVDNQPYNGELKVKLAIVSPAGESLWSNDNSSTMGSEPEISLNQEVIDGLLEVNLGEASMAALPPSMFDGSEPRSLIIWVSTGGAFEKFNEISLATTARSVNAERLGGRPAEDYLTKDAIKGLATLQAKASNGGAPVIRFNSVSSKWEFSNDGVTFSPMGAAQEKTNLTRSLEATIRTSGSSVLPLELGGTGGKTPKEARRKLGLRIGADVQKFIKNNWRATRAPNEKDDTTAGFKIGSHWIDGSSKNVYLALDVKKGAAVWAKLTSGEKEPTYNASLVYASGIANLAVTNAKLANNAVTTTKILDRTIAAADIKTDTITATQVAANAIGSSELASTSVVAGTYPLATVVVDADGRITSATAGSIPEAEGEPLLHPVMSRRFGYAFPAISTATTFTAIGMNAPTTPTGTATAQPALAGTTRMYIQYVTAATLNLTGGLTGGAFTFTRPDYRPKFTARIRTGTSIANQRLHVGVTESSLAAVVTNTTGTTASAVDFASIVYDKAGTGNRTDWLCCSGDGTNYGCDTIGVAVAVSTEYDINLDWTTAGTLVCTVNGTSVTKITNLSTAAVNIGPYIGITTLTATAINFAIAKYGLEQN